MIKENKRKARLRPLKRKIRYGALGSKAFSLSYYSRGSWLSCFNSLILDSICKEKKKKRSSNAQLLDCNFNFWFGVRFLIGGALLQNLLGLEELIGNM